MVRQSTAYDFEDMKILTYDLQKKKTVLCGEFIADTFFRNVSSAHFMRVVNGYGIQEDAFMKICEKGCDKVIIKETDTDQQWESTIKDWKIDGRIMDFGAGKQRFLSMKFMKTHKQKEVIFDSKTGVARYA